MSTARITSVSVGGSIITGLDNSTGGGLSANASIRAQADIVSLTVTGSVIGRSTTNGTTPVIISAVHALEPTDTKDVAIGKVSIGGLASLVSIAAGYSTSLAATNADAQIGSVSVGGNWLTGNIIAGVENTAGTGTTTDDNINYGDTNDRLIGNAATSIAKIASITIKGIVAGSSPDGDHFGFVSRVIGSVKVAGYTAPMTTTASEILQLSRTTNDFLIHEV